MTPAVLALLPEAVSFVRWLLERYGGNRDAARAALRRIRDEWAEWERTKSAQSSELERVLKRRADFDDLRRASDTGPIPGELTPLEKPRGPKP